MSKTYKVLLKLETTVQVEAEDKDDAVEAAREELAYGDVDFDIKGSEVEEVADTETDDAASAAEEASED